MSDTSAHTTDAVNTAAPKGAGTETKPAALANLFLLLAKAFSLPGGLDPVMGADLEALIPNLPESLQDSAKIFARNWQQETAG